MRSNNSIFEKLHVPPRLIQIIKTIIPLSSRQKIKSYLGKYLAPATQIISEDILLEWQRHQPQPDTYDIIDFSVISWDLRFQRPQHLAIGLSKLGHRIFYIEHEFISHHRSQDSFAPIQVKKVQNNIYQITLSASRELFIYRESPSENDQKIILSSLKNLFHQAGIINPIAKIDHPFWQFLSTELSMPILYDCMDNHQYFHDSGKNITRLETNLVKESTATIVTSEFLQNKIDRISNHKSILIPNAGDYTFFANPNKNTPQDIKSISRPIIGYYGAISHWFDSELLEVGLASHPDKSFVLIGRIENQNVEDLSVKYKNLYLLGEKPYSELPEYLGQFDVCLIPFLLTPLIKATNPVKIFEYFAQTKPVVSTNLPELKKYPSIIFTNKNNFPQKIKLALKIKTVPAEKIISRNNTWTKRINPFNQVIQKLFPKISIVILSYNHPDLLQKTLDSVANHSFYPNLEIIIVDNASNEETVDLLNKYNHIKNIKIIFNQQNYGFAKGNNIGLKAATGDYLILLNNDVIVTPGWVSRLLFHVRKPNVGLVGPVTNSIGNEAKIDATLSDYQKYTYSHWGETLEVNNIAAFCWIISRETYQKIGDLDKRFGRGMFEDDDYCKRIKKIGLKILIADDVFIHHFGGASFKQLQSEEYQQLFSENKSKFETKWHTKWIPHQYRK